ncbi:hypothetical protein VKT23_002924 [Stygiomarasmius scandens]|uniref:Uncharacterized protein n=1 Tax=Marasmiellus scandens TaxID=2682957 RepID=A0ABR1K1D0_9AGAR
MFKDTIKLKLQSIRARITRNTFTTTFFIVILVHCIAQGIIQSLLLALDSKYNVLTNTIINAAQVPKANHTDLLVNSDYYRLQVCNFIPHNDQDCSIAFDTRDFDNGTIGNGVDTNPEHDSFLRGENIAHLIASGARFVANTSDPVKYLQVENPLQPTDSVTLSQQCIETLLYPSQHFHNARREDIALLVLQLWLLGISVLAVYYDSVPHILAGLIAHILFTTWSIYSLWRTFYQQTIFDQMIETPGTYCSISMFSAYFRTRIAYEICDLVLNITAFAFATYSTWYLVRVFNTKSVQRLAAPKRVKAIYGYFLAVQVCLQLEAFIMMTWMGLWLDQLENSYVSQISNHLSIFRGIFVWYTVLLGPWMLLGWWGIRLEKRILTAVFILMSFVFTAVAGIMLYSQVYRWTFYAWPFFGCMVVFSLVLLVFTFPLSILCWMNFGKGLAQYLHADSVLASSNFTIEVFEHDVEKDVKPDRKTSLHELGL